MRARIIGIVLVLLTGICCLAPTDMRAQEKPRGKEKKVLPPREDPATIRFQVEGGVRKQMQPAPDTTSHARIAADSLTGDTLRIDLPIPIPDSILTVPTDSTFLEKTALELNDTLAADTTALSERQLRRLEKQRRYADSSFVRYSPIFRDTMPISRVAAISLVAPGFGQLYNQQYWKIPILYGSVGTALYFGLKFNSRYRTYRNMYDYYKARGETQMTLDPIQNRMIRNNTYRQLLIGGAVAAYIYFLGDGVVNYPSGSNAVKKATTLSMFCPGAGQFYNRSYWKVPIVAGGFATLLYMIDWNNRGYKRFKLAYDLVTDGDSSTQDEFNGRYDAKYLSNLKQQYRRNRDLCIIITAGFYLLNVIDAHVDAHLKDYDISDDLSMNVEPMMDTFATSRGGGNLFGFNLNFRF